MAFIDKAAIWAVKKETTYGVADPIVYGTDFVEFIGPQMDGTIDRIEREVLSNSLVKKQSLLGKNTSSGTLPIEVSSTDGLGALNGDVLYESAMGVRIAPVASEVPTINTASTIDVALGTDWAIGQAVKVTVDGSPEYVTITAITGNTLSVSPSFVGTTATAIEGLLSYRLSSPSDATVSFVVQEYLEGNGTQVAYTYNGCVAASMGLEFPIASIIKSSFSVQGSEFAVSNVTDEAKVCATNTPQLAKNMTFTYDGTSYDISDLSVNVENDVQDIEAITTAGITDKFITGKSTVGGSFMLEYEGKALFDVYTAGTAGELNIKSIASNSKAFGVYAPKVILNNVSKTIDSAIYKDNVEFECLSSDACVDNVEDALTIWFE